MFEVFVSGGYFDGSEKIQGKAMRRPPILSVLSAELIVWRGRG